MHGTVCKALSRKVIDCCGAAPNPATGHCFCVQDGGPVLMDLLWSDPTTNDGVQGVQPSPRGPGLVTFGPDRVKDFCKVRGPSQC